MKQVRKGLTITFLMLALMAVTLVGTSAQSPLSATVDRTTLTTDDSLTLTVVVSSDGRSAPRPQLPDLDGFTVLGSSTSSQMSVINGAVSSSVAYSYRLQPYATGTLAIAPITATIGGQLASTEPITVEVSQGNGTPTQAPGSGAQGLDAPSQLGNQALFVEASVDNPEPYVGEQITYTFRFYEAADSMRVSSLFMDQPGYNPPALTGFWSEGEIENEAYRVSHNGRIYTVTELRSQLFPTAAGDMTVGPAQLTIPGFGFQRGGVLQSEPVTLTVQPLPAGAPPSFTGAVGQFDLRAELDTQQTQLDEPIMATVTIAGWGNVGTAGDPAWPEADGWRTFTGDAQVETVIQDGRVGGTRIYEHTLIPTQAGDLRVPALEYTYFDPTTEEYRTISTESYAVAVAPGPNGEMTSAVAAVVNEGNSATDETTAMLQPMALPATLSMSQAPMTSQPWYWGLWALPMATLASGLAFRQRQAYQVRNADAIRRSKAHKEAKRTLAKLSDGNDSIATAQAGYILTDYLSVKLGQSVSGSTADDLAATLRARGVDPALSAEVQRFLTAMEASRYCPAATPATVDLRTEVGLLINQLDASL